jgi:hypothetical protein
MRLIMSGAALALILLDGLAMSVRADVSAGASVSDEGLKSFYLAIGENYRVPEKDVIVVREKKIPDEELPVVFYLADRANVKPAAIVDLRLAGKSWMEVTTHFKLAPDIYYVALKDQPRPPYARAWSHFKKRPRNQWREIVLGDVDVINLVNLKFISARYGYPPDAVVKMRADGLGFVKINAEVKARRARNVDKGQALATKDDRKQADNPKGKGKDKEK